MFIAKMYCNIICVSSHICLKIYIFCRDLFDLTQSSHPHLENGSFLTGMSPEIIILNLSFLIFFETNHFYTMFGVIVKFGGSHFKYRSGIANDMTLDQ